MSTYYLDTSALVKRYVDETGSSWLQTTLETPPRPSIILVQLAIVEMTSALMRRVREGAVSAPEYTQIQNAFLSDCLGHYELVAVVDDIINKANRLLEEHPLRAYDAIHLAAAVVSNQALVARDLPPLLFLSADDRLNQAASVEGLAVDNPNGHP